MFTNSGRIIGKIFLTAAILCATALSAYGQDDATTIGAVTWTTRNLGVPTEGEGSWCYDNNQDNCSRYGRLYTWEEAAVACMARGEGWRLPRNDEWATLVNVAGMTGVAAGKLKAKSGWKGNGSGTDDHGFAALPGGHRFIDGKFYDITEAGYWWSADAHVGNDAYYIGIMYNSRDEAIDVIDKGSGLSVRCVKD